MELVRAALCGLTIMMCMGLLQPADARELSVVSFGSAEGLTDIDISAVFVDRSGFVLAASEHGVFYFDGQVFKNLGSAQGLPNGGFVSDIMEDRRHRLVLVYSNAVYVASTPLSNLKSPESIVFRLLDPLPGPPSYLDGRHFAIWGDRLLFSNSSIGNPSKDVSSIDLVSGKRANVTLRLSPDNVPNTRSQVLRVFAVGFQSGFDVALDDGRICDFDIPLSGGGGQDPAALYADGYCVAPQGDARAHPWLAAARGPDGSIWFRSAASLVHLFRRTHMIEQFPSPVDGLDRRLADDAFDVTAEGQIIIPGRSGLIYGTPGRWEWFGPFPASGSHIVRSVTSDQNGTWLATYGGGLMFVNGLKHWTNYNKEDGLSDDQIWAVGVTSAAVWFATAAGISSMSTLDAVPHFTTVTKADQAFIISQCGNDRLFVIDVKGEVIDIVGSQVFRPSIKAGVVRSAACDITATAWIGQRAGLSRLDLRDPVPTLRPVPAITGKIVAAYGDMSRGLWYIDTKKLCHFIDTIINCPVTHWPDPNFEPRTVMTDKPDSVWVGGSGGPLYHVQLNRASGTVRRIDGIEPPTIVSNTVVALAHDRRGWIWVGTDQGASVFDGHRWTGITMEDGLIWNDIVQDGIAIAPDDSVWFATSNGASHLIHPQTIFDRPPLKLAIISAIIGHEPLAGGHAYMHRPVEIVFGTLDAATASAIRFRYRLDGVDDTWVDTAEHIARYPAMPPGEHIFRVYAYNPITHQVSPEIDIEASIRPPWWRWWWIDMLGAVLIALMIYGAVRLRLLHLLRRERELEMLVAERTRAIKAAQDALVIQATMDGLTQTYNRGAIQDRLDHALRRDVGARENWLTIGLLDVDHFKRINDIAGHLAGDEVLREFGARLRAHALPEEHIGRYGGEEFLILVEGDPEHGHARMARLKTLTTGRAFIFNNEAMRVTCSIGVAHARAGDTWQTLVSRADASLYAAKKAGRDCIVDGEQDPRAMAVAMRRARRRYRDMTA